MRHKLKLCFYTRLSSKNKEGLAIVTTLFLNDQSAMTDKTPCACIHDADAVAREDRMAGDLPRVFLLLFWVDAKKVSGVSVF